MSIDPIIAANGIIRHAENFDSFVTPMKLQKLAFLVHGLLLAEQDRHTGIASGFEAWPYGPVNRDMYFAFRKYGGQPITDTVDEMLDSAVPSLNGSVGGDVVEMAIAEVWRAFGSWTAAQLSDFTHKAGSPWFTSVEAFKAERKRGPEPFDGVPIPDEEIRSYFVRELLAKP